MIRVTRAFRDRGVIQLINPSSPDTEAPKEFTFDAVFDEECSQRQLYDVCAAPVVQSVLEGYNGTIFAYGQTGAGKTHTMEGDGMRDELKGIIPNAIQHIFDHVSLNGGENGSRNNVQFLVRASYFEIYNEEIRDLLSDNSDSRLELRESSGSGVYVKNLKSFVVKSVPEIDKLLQDGRKNRSVGSTAMNMGSSRSHSVFTIVVEQSCDTNEIDIQSSQTSRRGMIRVGKLNLVDLAGSERQAKTGASGMRLKEATKINLSLSALGNVISALVDGKSKHVPYRDSKLTRILQDSLGGNTKTVMCANAGPADYNYDETLSTLRYANRAKNIKNKPKINEDSKDALLREYQDEILRLQTQLKSLSSEISPSSSREEMKVTDEEYKDFSNQQSEIKQNVNNDSGKTYEEHQKLQQKLKEESAKRTKMEEERKALFEKLTMLEEKVIKGGKIVDMATKQEAELRKVQQHLVAREETEKRLAREMAAQEEMNIQLEGKFDSIQEETRAKSKKLQKLWSKYQQSISEINDLQHEFQEEREDFLSTIRSLNKTLRLKELIISNFIPTEVRMNITRANDST